MRCSCVRDDALDCARARYGDTDEPCECCCHDATEDEREACARVADAMALAPHDRVTARAIAANIRARKNT